MTLIVDEDVLVETVRAPPGVEYDDVVSSFGVVSMSWILLLLVLLLLLLFVVFKVTQQQPPQSSQSHTTRRRHSKTVVVYYGPTQYSLRYQAYTPTTATTPLRLTLHLDKLQLQYGNNNKHYYKDDDVTVSIQSPVVLELVFQNTTQPLEHTMPHCAQFQQDLLGMQLLGRSILHMYKALELLHQGSGVALRPEFVLHYYDITTTKPQPQQQQQPQQQYSLPTSHGVAWDDVSRCWEPMIVSKDYLHRLWWKGHTVVATTKDLGIKPEYQGKRLLLGLVDVFRIFVPLVEDGPFDHTSEERAKVWLERKKKVADAAVLVQAYVKARKLANLGWSLHKELPHRKYLSRRLAFDENMDNARHDSSSRASNEYYEGTVSRDVLCPARSSFARKWHSILTGFSTQPSAVQGFTLVGMHCFRLPTHDTYHPLSHDRDPVLAIPSLTSLVQDNASLDFFVVAYFAEGQRHALVKVFVRSLPKGVDSAFDETVETFWQNDERERNKRLECMIQLGTNKDDISLLSRLVIGLLSLFLRMVLRGTRVPLDSSMDRTSLPSFKVASLGPTRHFGGSLQRDDRAPRNYVATTIHLNSRSPKLLSSRIMIAYLEQGGSSKDVMDCTYLLAARSPTQVPERALATIRLVHLFPQKISLPTKYSVVASRLRVDTDDYFNRKMNEERGASLYFRIFFTDPILYLVESLTRSRRERLPSYSQRDTSLRAARGFETAPDATKQNETTGGNSLVPRVRSILESIEISRKDGAMERISSSISDHDIRRYLEACKGQFEETCQRLTRTALWYSSTFPVDTRTCRVELQNGQFFQQGLDLDGFPIFYIRYFCLGPWRGNEEALIRAMLHRFESAVQEFSRGDPNVRFTVIVMLGKPARRKRAKFGLEEDADTRVSGLTTDDESLAFSTDPSLADSSVIDDEVNFSMNNPRLRRKGVSYQRHGNKETMRKLIDLLLQHYPERLHKALMVVGHGNSSPGGRTAVGGAFSLISYVPSSRTRRKVFFLTRYSDLKEHVEESELVRLVGGSSPIEPQAYFDT